MENRPFPSSPGPLFQNEDRYSSFDMKIIFHSHADNTHFHKKGCARSLILKVRVFGARKWPIKKRECFRVLATPSRGEHQTPSRTSHDINHEFYIERSSKII